MARQKKQHEELEVVVVKMAPSLVAALNELARRQYRTRSDIVRQCVLREIEANKT
jgi:metal-responsive CopG/Arc/MetJ family transcriptional regulator